MYTKVHNLPQSAQINCGIGIRKCTVCPNLCKLTAEQVYESAQSAPNLCQQRLRALTWRVPISVACVPGQVGGEGSEEVVQGPSQDHVVVDGGQRRHQHHGDA